MTLSVPSYYILSTSKEKNNNILDIIFLQTHVATKNFVLWSSLCYWANKNCLFFNFNPSVRSKECNYPSFYLNCAWYNYFVEYTTQDWAPQSVFFFKLKLLLSIIFCLNKTNSSYGTTHFNHVIITQLLMLLLFVNSFSCFFFFFKYDIIVRCYITYTWMVW